MKSPLSILMAVGILVAPAIALAHTDRTPALSDSIAALRQHGHYDEALDLARELATQRDNDPAVPLHERRESRLLVETLEFIIGLADSSRARLARAEAMTPRIETLYAAGDFAEAERLGEEQIAVRSDLLGPDHLEVAYALASYSAALYRLDRLKEAEKAARRGMTILRREFDDHPQLAETIDNLAECLRGLGRPAEAVPLSRESLAMRKRIEPASIPNALNNLALILWDLGDVEAAGPLLSEAVTGWRRTLGEEDPNTGLVIMNLATFYQQIGDYREAERLYEESIDLLSASLGETHPYTALAVQNLGRLFYEKGDARADSIFRIVEAIYVERDGSDAPQLHMVLSNRAEAAAAMGKYAEAMELDERALAQCVGKLGDEHPLVATTISHIGYMLFCMGRPEAAESRFRSTLATREKLLGATHPHVVSSLRWLGKALRAQSRFAEAESLLERAASAYEIARLRVEKGGVLDPPYEELALTLLARGKTDPAWPAVERSQGRLLADLIFASHRRSLSAQELRMEDALKLEIADLERRLETYQQAATGDAPADAAPKIAETRQRLLGLESEWATFRRELQAAHPITEGNPLPLARVQRDLPPRTAIIGWLEDALSPRSPWIYTIRRDGPVRWTRSDSIGPAPDSLARLRDLFARPDPTTPMGPAGARGLWEQRLAPVERQLAELNEIIVIPSAPMWGIPIEAAVGPDGLPLGARLRVTYAPSASISTRLREASRASRPPRRGALLVGDPPFSATDHDRTPDASPSGFGISTALLRGATGGNAFALDSLPRLPGSRAEVEGLAPLWADATILLGADASEQGIVELNASGELGRFRVLHFATHALIDSDRPQSSCLVLSRADLPDALAAAEKGRRVYDGRLTIGEILNEWDLDSDLVTLSACDTGLGRKGAGDGYTGLANTLLQVGARSVLVSLWKVDDRATSLLMQRFYRNWLGGSEEMPRAEALREAKMWLRSYRDATGNEPYRHPFYWAAFVLIGASG